MNIMRRISKEYDEPFVDVVKGFAAMRFSKAETARTINVSRGYFYELLDRFKLHDYFYGISEQVKVSRPCRIGWEHTDFKHYTDDELITEVAKYKDTNEFKKHSKIAFSTIYRRFGGYKNARSLSNG